MSSVSITQATGLSTGGKWGAFWGGLWGLLFGAAFLIVPGIGPVVAAGSVVDWIIAALEGAVVVGGSRRPTKRPWKRRPQVRCSRATFSRAYIQMTSFT